MNSYIHQRRFAVFVRDPGSEVPGGLPAGARRRSGAGWATKMILGLALLASAGWAAPPVPEIVDHLGFLQVNGIPFNGAGQFKFALVDQPGTTTIWSHDGTSVGGGEPASALTLTVTKGRYSAPLGDTTIPNMTEPLPPSYWTNPELYLRIWFNDGVNGWQLLAPDKQIVSVGFALRAATVPDGSIGTAQLAPSAVTTAQILDGTVTSADIANGTIASADIADSTITSADIANGTVASADIADGTITSADVLDGTLTLADLSLPSVDARYVLKAGDTMTGKLTADGGIATSSITNLSGILSLKSATDIELQIDNGGGAAAAFEIFNGAGAHVFVASETGNARTFGTHAIDGGLMVGTTTLDANAVAQINLPSSVSVPHLRIKSPLNNNGFGVQFANPTETWYVGPNIGNWNDHRFNILADSSNKGLIIAANGNVGIDSVSAASPFATLTIDGTIGFATVSTPAMYVYASGTSNPEKPLIVHSPAFPEYGLYYSDAGDQFVMKSAAGDTAPSLVVDLDGNWVTIATTTPKPGYELSVNGQIVCEELLVQDSGSWPDHVFNDDYRLQPLAEVEAHIKERKHLPGIPTAAEVAREGIPIGDMQKRMMEKIEELTLHLIEQNKRLAAQDERIRQIEAQRQRAEAAQ